MTNMSPDENYEDCLKTRSQIFHIGELYEREHFYSIRNSQGNSSTRMTLQ